MEKFSKNKPKPAALLSLARHFADFLTSLTKIPPVYKFIDILRYSPETDINFFITQNILCIGNIFVNISFKIWQILRTKILYSK